MTEEPENAANEDEFEDSEPTPVTAAVRMEEGYPQKFRIIRAVEGTYLRDMYHEAFEYWAEKRDELGDDPEILDLLEFYSQPPKGSWEGAERLSLSVHEEGIERLMRWAEKDGRPYIAAVYTALHWYLDKRSDELDF